VVEGLDIARLRAVPLRVVIGVLCLVGVVLAIVVPDLVPPTPLVGAAVALAALLLGLAVAVAVDAVDLTIRGPRHVRAAGGELVAILPSEPDPQGAVPLAEAVLEAREGEGQRLLLGLAAAGRDARRCSAWTDALAVALASTGASVLRVDLANGRSERAGLVEVVREGRKLPSVVTFDPDLRLARIGAGHDHSGALEALPTLPTRLPRDLDVLLVALPTAASRQVVAATAALDHVLVVAERDSTSRVDLIAGLDALEAAGIAAQVMLLDDRTAARLSPAATAEEGDVAAEDRIEGPDADAGDAEADAGDVEVDAGDVEGGAGDVEVDAGDAAAADGSDDDPAGAGDADLEPVVGGTLLDGATDADEPVEPQAAGGSHIADGPHAAADAADVDPDRAETPPTGDGATGASAGEVGPTSARRSADDAPPGAGSSDRRTADRGPDTGVRLLPGADPTPRPPSPDLRQPSVAPRDVDVLLGAAAASAVAHAETSHEPLPPIARRGDGASTPDDGPDRATSPPSAPAETQLLPPATAGSAPGVPDPVDVTEEIPPVDPESPPRSPREPDEPERDDLRTTAQLAILLDDLQARRDHP
jgi:hypothetical protein